MNLIGNLLVAPPSVTDYFWQNSVIMVTEHHIKGSIGIMINKPSSYTIRELGVQLGLNFDLLPGYAYIGGPVHTSSLSILHSNDWRCNNTMKINEQFSLSSSNDMLAKFEKNDMPHQWRMFAGMCCWRPAQLHAEIKGIAPYRHETSWCVASSSHDLVFESDNSDQWVSSIEQAGIDFAQSILPC